MATPWPPVSPPLEHDVRLRDLARMGPAAEFISPFVVRVVQMERARTVSVRDLNRASDQGGVERDADGGASGAAWNVMPMASRPGRRGMIGEWTCRC